LYGWRFIMRLPEFVVDVFCGWLRRDFLHRIARIAEGSA